MFEIVIECTSCLVILVVVKHSMVVLKYEIDNKKQDDCEIKMLPLNSV